MMFYAGNGSSIFLPWTGTQKVTQSKDSLGYKHRTLGSKGNTMEQNEQIWRSNHRILNRLGSPWQVKCWADGPSMAQHGPAWPINENQWLRSPRWRLRQLRMSSPLCKGALPAELQRFVNFREQLAFWNSPKSAKPWFTLLVAIQLKVASLAYLWPQNSTTKLLDTERDLNDITNWQVPVRKRVSHGLPCATQQRRWIQYFTSEETAGTQWLKHVETKKTAYLRIWEANSSEKMLQLAVVSTSEVPSKAVAWLLQGSLTHLRRAAPQPC